MENAYNAYYADCSQERSEISSAARQGYQARRNLSKEGSRLFFAFRVVAFLAAALAFASCARDLEGMGADKDGTALVTLSLNVPAPPTRAFDDAAEGAIDRIDVLLFKGGNLYYRTGVSSASITPDGSNPNTKKSFTVRLPIGDGYEAVVLAKPRAR
ncbi:MAG: hypothetical protein LBG30_06770 [Odoribacteraceae bacterium]|nr:hypothetical protein [Odoribacteraceae bacterium]